MNEGNVRNELYRMLRYRYGLWPDHFPDIPGIKKQPGRPDLVVMNPFGPGFYMEVKVINVAKETAFKFNNISDGQRLWLSTWEEARCDGSWLGLGVIGTRPRKMYIIPWNTWLSIEESLTPFQSSLPYKAGPGYKVKLRTMGLDFRLLELFSCIKVKASERIEGESGWRIPPTLEPLWIQSPFQVSSKPK